jgi:hypothetical protein
MITMNAFKMNKNTKTGKSAEPVHKSTMDGSSHMKGISPTSAGPLSPFYSMGPALSLKGLVQPKLTIGQPNDRYEQEADRVADQVMRMPESKGSLVNGHLSLGKREKESSLVQQQSTCPECPEKEEIQTKPVAEQITPLVQRQEEGPEEEEEEPVQTKPISDQITPLIQRQEEVPEEEETPIQAKSFSGTSSQLAPGLQSRLQSIRGGGQPLPKSVRNYFEPRFGTDFSHVRVHTGLRAANLTKSINAKAFTIGKDVVFNAGQYSPNTQTGKSFIAHELTHVTQQQSGQHRVQRRTDQVIQRPIRNNAKTCLLHLHGTEKNALKVAQDLYNAYCVNLVYIHHPKRRLINVDVPGHRGVICRADPNRIFNNAAITSKWPEWNSGRCLRNPVMKAAQTAVINFRDNELNPKIRQCRGQSIVGTKIPGTGPTGSLPIVVFHGNVLTKVGTPKYRRQIGTRKESLTILSYCPRHLEEKAADKRTQKVRGVTIQHNSKCIKTISTYRPILNPHIEKGQNPDDFILVTKPTDFLDLVNDKRNVVLQDQNPPKDGSLSVVLSKGRYINIEAQLGRRKEQEKMGKEVLQNIGVRKLPCP